MGFPVVLLNVALAVSLALWVASGWRQNARAVLPAYLAGIGIQCFHFAEEVREGFQAAFPPVFGAGAWGERQFVVFNLVWLGVFLLAAVGVYRRLALAYLAVFFFALGGGVGNGMGHLLLSLRAGGYFPGTWTAPLSLVAGIVILRQLYAAPKVQPAGDIEGRQ